MIGALILAISVLALLQFFVTYCHSLITVSRSYPLSEETLQIASISSPIPQHLKFRRLLQLAALCPEQGNDKMQVLAVSAYFRLLGPLRMLCSWIAPAATRWVDSERGGCTYVVAVTLDRRIAGNRVLASQHSGDGF
jgi:hypothetical protein